MKFTRVDDGSATVLSIEGVLDALTVPEIRPAIDDLVMARPASVTVDLSGLRLIDSSGVGLIVSLYKRCKEHGGTVRLTGIASQPLAIFKLLRLDRVFGIQHP
jgi:anti-sigma B factor antagonist